jgi:hypothetical protein
LSSPTEPRVRVRHAGAYEHVVLRHALGLAVGEDVAVDAVPHGAQGWIPPTTFHSHVIL